MKLWGGRFAKPINEQFHEFNASLSFDFRLYDEDITGSIVWAWGLVGAGVLTPREAEEIAAGLEQIRGECRQGTINILPDDEDIHSLVERRLTELIGPLAGKLHTGRSRNDQVATDFRLWTMRAIDHLISLITELQESIVENAEANLALPMPGYTHLQHAQLVTWGHWILSHFWPLTRDVRRLTQARAEAAILPLGSGALAGTSYAVDREALAAELGFESISQNSLDAVSDRDFAADFLYAAALLGVHISRLSEQLILFSSTEFGFIVLDDAYSTGSSLMPQKKNPDALELARGKAGRLLGDLTGLLVTLKGLPSAYDKDLQEDKGSVFDAFDTLTGVLPVLKGVISTLQVKSERMAAQIEPNLLATDLADYLVKQGMPFRQAHELAGQAVQLAEEKGVPLTELSPTDFQSLSGNFAAEPLSNHFGEDVAETLRREVFSVTNSLASRAVPGGTAPEALRRQLELAAATMRIQ